MGKAFGRKRRHVNTGGIEGAHLRLGERLGEEEMAWHEEARKNTKHRGGEDRGGDSRDSACPLMKTRHLKVGGFPEKEGYQGIYLPGLSLF